MKQEIISKTVEKPHVRRTSWTIAAISACFASLHHLPNPQFQKKNSSSTDPETKYAILLKVLSLLWELMASTFYSQDILQVILSARLHVPEMAQDILFACTLYHKENKITELQTDQD